MNSRNLFLRFTEGADLPGESLPGVPLVEIAGDRRVLIENHNGVTAYSCERIEVRVGYGTVCVTGEKLELSRMTASQLIISGSIHGIKLIKGGL